MLIYWLIVRTEVAAQNLWQPTSGPATGVVLSLAINADGHIFAGTDSGGIFRSIDNGDSLVLVNTGLTNAQVLSLAINPTTGAIFAGTAGDTVFRSTDNGDHWMPSNAGLAYANILSLAINDSGHIFAGTEGGGIFRSTNNGNTWSNTGLSNTFVPSLRINKLNGYIFAGTFVSGVLRSTNNGNTWSNTGLTNTFVPSLAINMNGHIFAGTPNGVYRSTDNGCTWRLVNRELANQKIVRSFVINASGHVFTGNRDGILCSTDNGNTWEPVNTGLTNTLIRALAVNANRRMFAGTAGGGVFRSIDSAAPTITPELLFTQPHNQQFAVDAKVDDDLGIAEVTLSLRGGGDAKFDTVRMANQDDSYQATIPADSVTSRGVECFITATDVFCNTTRLPPSGTFSIQVRIENPGVLKGRAQPNGSEQTAYRLISVPLNVDNKSPVAVLEDDLGKYDKKKWRFYELKPDQSYIEFPNTSEMTSGKAFWLIVKESDKTISTGSGISNPTDTVSSVSLHPRWNFVGNPFNFPIPINKLRLKSGRPIDIRFYDGAWTDALSTLSVLSPFEGYALFANTADKLFINPNLSESTISLPQALPSSLSENILWSIRIRAQCQEARDVDNLAVVSKKAANIWDEMERAEPPIIGEYVSVYFPHREWQTLAKTYCIDARPEPTNGEIWDFEVKTNIRDKVNLTFEGLDDVPLELEVWLVDDALKITRNLRESNHYAIAGSEQPKQLKLVVGQRDFVEEKLAEAQAIPTTYELFQNFPNPFNPVTTIRYGLPRAERVTLKVYNLLGEEVVTLVNNEQKAAGYHTAIWDGRNKDGRVVASGVYVYWIRAGSYSATRKLALVK